MTGLASGLGCTDATCQLFRGVLQVFSTECDVQSLVLCTAVLVAVTAALLLSFWPQNRSSCSAWRKLSSSASFTTRLNVAR